MDIKTFLKKYNFNFYIPVSCDVKEISFREEGERWSTLRFLCDYKGMKYRFKEFFLDWFYTGYPKSLMKNFMETYSIVKFEKIGEFNVFFGFDYKNLYAASIYHKGTQIEIEALDDNYDKNNFEELILSINQIENANLNDLPFHLRSFHARSKKWEWFEEKRIALANWYLLPKKMDHYNVSVGDLEHSTGKIEFFIFSNSDFSQVMWLEFVDENIGIENAYYKFRKKIGIYNEIFENHFTLFGIRHPSGPALMQNKIGNKVITFTSNSYNNKYNFIKNYDKALMFLSANLNKDLFKFMI
jgi:hypothetical protein